MSLGVLPGRTPGLHELISAYDSSGRYYHTLGHIRDCLRELDSCRASAREPGLIELAIWYHDAIYDPSRHDNEARSAAMARDAMNNTGLPPTAIERVQAMILATRHLDPSGDADARLLVDIDLSILGRPQAEFDRYEDAIRREYQRVPDHIFAQEGRPSCKNYSSERGFIQPIYFRNDTRCPRGKICFIRLPN